MDDDDLQRFVDDLTLMIREVPLEVVIHKIRSTIADDEAQLRRVMSLFAYLAKGLAPSKVPIDRRAHDQLLDVIIALGSPKETRDEGT
jgi:hypothetical protein